MKAFTKYNDLSGTAAADIDSDKGILKEYLKNKGVDIELYQPIGIKCFFNRGKLSLTEIICLQK